jgi:LacI family transcriptional regulator
MKLPLKDSLAGSLTPPPPAPPRPSPLPRTQRNVTVKDVAARAGVTQPAVSVVLNGARSNTQVSDVTRQKILQAARDLGYRPNLSAQTMKSGKSRMVGVLLRNNSRLQDEEILAHPLTYEMVLGINEGLDEAGYMMALVRLSDVDPVLHAQSSAFQGHLLDGLIIVSDVLAATPERLEQLIPHAVWLDSSTWHEHNCIRRDEVAAGHLAGRSLAQAGYRDWIYLRRPEGAREHYSAAHRQVGVLAAAGDARANLRIAYQDFGQEIDPAFITALTPQTGLILGDPYFIPEVMRASMRARRCPGQDFALVACDEEFASTGYTWEDLSRVSFPRFDMGVRAAQMMISILDGPGPSEPSQVVSHDFRPGSTLPPCPREV